MVSQWKGHDLNRWPSCAEELTFQLKDLRVRNAFFFDWIEVGWIKMVYFLC